ncbi:hypothetical protein [Rhodococcus opacus]|nr:hypothetical protein [Rhodococcus opacus]MDJ0420010.1 hypothetical protein [Rhodococcus opacus]
MSDRTTADLEREFALLAYVAALYELLLSEYPEWLRAARNARVLS